MVCQDTTSSLKINYKKNIGEVILIVEGASDEMELFERIFHEVLKYKCIEKRRTKDNFRELTRYVRPENENCRVAILNAKNSNISTLRKDNNYLDKVFMTLYDKYGIDIKNARVYFVWDRDRESNKLDDVEYFLKNLTSSLDNDDGNMHGLLLLSYPNLGSYIISNFNNKYSEKNDKDLKEYMKDRQIYISNITDVTIKNATARMHKALKSFNINDYNIDKMGDVNLNILNKQENFYNLYGYYRWISFISIIFLDLQIITER